jgi:hypothetical protein
MNSRHHRILSGEANVQHGSSQFVIVGNAGA